MKDPFTSLPQHLAAAVFAQLDHRDAAALSLVCWRWRPHACTALVNLTITPRSRFPAARLHECINLQQLTVHTNRCDAWRHVLRALQERRLPHLQSITLQHFAGDDPSMLDELAHALQVRW